MFEYYLSRWDLTPDGEPIITHSSRLLPVHYKGISAMLKIAMVDEERWGGLLMEWWNGVGAARVLAHENDALLMERAEGKASLIKMAQYGQDDEASQTICNVAAKLHAPRNCQPPTLVSLSRWFTELELAALQYGGVLLQSAATALELLSEPQDIVILHGDIHHGNILDFGAHGWLAIDPKGLIGERGFDFANIFCNPDMEIATQPGRLTQQLNVIAEAAKLERLRLLKWVLAYAGLSAAWTLGDGEKPEIAIAVAKLAIAELEKFL
jgi:streptomycin 6-kinase